MRVLGWLLGVAVIASGCSLPGMGSMPSSMSCENVPAGACDEQVRLLTAGLSGVSDVIIQCRAAPPCTRAGGGGMAEIRFANGQKLNRAWSYVGDPGPLPPVTCVGVAQPLCLSYAQPEIDAVSPSKRIGAIDATCTSTTCAEASGEMRIRITLTDGSVQETTTGWSSGP